MVLLGTLGLVVVAAAAAAFVAERREARRQERRLRPWFVATDVVGGLFGLVVAVVAFTS
ncbi:hypothetical protein [Amnibacterium sp.]|uniref:hypothetical protein n=1 Tax=Amnibacterium sp. TaxID=1872496 RepID=UPI0026082B02|nr:hypothetical protein [Amnibacterium sp.]MCU1472045.1 hypothetical protein [Amnibacterium sp.]